MSKTVRHTDPYKLYPTPEQAPALETVVWRCRTRSNGALEQRKTWWERGQGVGAASYQQQAELPDLKAAPPEFTDVQSQVLQEVLLRVEHTSRACFRRVQTGQTPGYPRFQGRGRYHSFTYPRYGSGVVLDGGVLSLSKIGRMPIRLHRRLAGVPKTFTLSREADGWYACISCAEVPTQPLPSTGQETGIDGGLKVFLVTAAGALVEHPRQYRKAEKRLAKAQKRLSRHKKGSKRYDKARRLLAKKHQKVKRQRRDFPHKTALSLLRTYDTIYLEDLRIAHLVRNHHLAKSISDAGWAQFRSILEAKAADAGRQVVAVPAHYTSQDCSSCGARVQKSLSVRTHACPACGLVLDRDENAAKNILRAGQAHRGAGAQWSRC